MARFNIGQTLKLRDMPLEHKRMEGRMVRVQKYESGLYVVVPFAKLTGDTGDRYEVEEGQLQTL